jgi:acyl carrier protein
MTPPPADREALERVVRDTLMEIAPEIEPAALDTRSSLRAQVDLDSADWLEFLIRLHKATGIDIPDSVARTLTTLERVVDHLAGPVPVTEPNPHTGRT